MMHLLLHERYHQTLKLFQFIKRCSKNETSIKIKEICWRGSSGEWINFWTDPWIFNKIYLKQHWWRLATQHAYFFRPICSLILQDYSNITANSRLRVVSSCRLTIALRKQLWYANNWINSLKNWMNIKFHPKKDKTIPG